MNRYHLKIGGHVLVFKMQLCVFFFYILQHFKCICFTAFASFSLRTWLKRVLVTVLFRLVLLWQASRASMSNVSKRWS